MDHPSLPDAPAPDPAPQPAPDSLAALAARHGETYRWKLLATLMVGSMASVMSSTIVNVAVPDLVRHFGIGQERAQWVATAFMAAMTLAMLPTPWLLGRYGYRRVVQAALALLALGGLAGGLAPWYGLVIAMRVAEGLAAGVLQVVPGVLVMRLFHQGEQGRASGIFGFGVVLAPALGPTVGGLLVEHYGWRSIFFVVLPFCALALPLVGRLLPNRIDPRPGATGPAAGAPRPPLDWAGLALAAAGVLSLLNGLVHLHDGAHGLAFGLISLALLSLAVFVRHQWRGAAPLLNLRLLRHRQVAMGWVVAFIYGMGLFGSTYLLPVFMQTALHFPPSESGAVLLPAGLVLAVTISLAGRLADHWPPHGLVAGGLALLAASFGLMTTVDGHTRLAVLMAWAIVGRIGLGFVLPALSLGAMRGLQPAELAQGSSGINVVRQLGGAIGISVVGIMLEGRLQAAASAGRPAQHAFAETFWMVAACCALATLAALRMKAVTPATAPTPDRR